jgi:DNA-binding transcriptional ArsR family regulator
MVEQKSAGLDRTFSALANATRRGLLERLAQGEATVTELARPYDMSLAAISKHLVVLERAGLVQRRVAGREHWLSLSPEPMAPAVSWLTGYRRFWEGSLQALASLLESETSA